MVHPEDAYDDHTGQPDAEVPERAGPWKSGEGDYPFADEVYDLTHPFEPDPNDWADDR
jgi:hypothetical protein